MVENHDLVSFRPSVLQLSRKVVKMTLSRGNLTFGLTDPGTNFYQDGKLKKWAHRELNSESFIKKLRKARGPDP